VSDVTDEPERVRFASWLDAPVLAEIRRLAADETDGNASFMLRRLIDEALAARAAQPSPRPKRGVRT